MYFTLNDYIKIENWLLKRTIKDTLFPETFEVKNSDKLPIIQDSENKIIPLLEFIKYIASLKDINLYNISDRGITLEDAINIVPTSQRKLGLIITFCNEDNLWLIFLFLGNSLNSFSDITKWSNIIHDAIEHLIVDADEEDLTKSFDGSKYILSFKDKLYDPSTYSGMGFTILRKNLVGVDDPSILDDQDHYANVLLLEYIKADNTIYLIQYDYDLLGKMILIPKNSALLFKGGSFNNGTIYLLDTPIIGKITEDSVGKNLTISGSYKKGLIFIKDTEIEAYDNTTQTTISRTSSKYHWYNGTSWVPILDLEYYNELASFIKILVNNYNSEIANINTKILAVPTLVSTIANLLSTVENYVRQYINNVVFGVSSILVNGNTYTPNASGVVSLPNYPTLVPHTLTFTGSSSATFNGSLDVTVNIPNMSLAVSTVGTLTILDNWLNNLGTFNGALNVTITLPNLVIKTLTLKDQSGNILGTFNGTLNTDFTIRTPSLIYPTLIKTTPSNRTIDVAGTTLLDPYNVDITQTNQLIDLSTINYGTATQGIVLLSASYQFNVFDIVPVLFENLHLLIRTEVFKSPVDRNLHIELFPRSTNATIVIHAVLISCDEDTTFKTIRYDNDSVIVIPGGSLSNNMRTYNVNIIGHIQY